MNVLVEGNHEEVEVKSRFSVLATARRGAVLASVVLCAMQASGQVTTIESLGAGGVPGNGWSQDAKFARGDEVIAFASNANNLVPGDTGGTDIFVRDRAANTIVRVSVRADGTQAPGTHWHPDITPDARFIVWSSDATSLAQPATVGRHIFLRDRDANGNGIFDEPGHVTVELISVSGDGTPGNGPSSMPVISGDGRFIAFQSDATNLANGDGNGAMDIFVRDRLSGKTTLVSRGLGDQSGAGLSNVPNISRDGAYIIFQSNAPDLVAGDTNATTDVFRYATATGAIETVSVTAEGASLAGGSVLGSEAVVGPCLSGDGRHIVFQSTASNAVSGDGNGQIDILAKDMTTGRVSLISMRANGEQTQFPSVSPTISVDGRFVVFGTQDPLIVPGDTNRRQDMFLRDRDDDNDGIFDEPSPIKIRRVSVGSDGIQPTLASYGGRICDDGRCVLFTTTAGNLVPGDTNGFPDVFHNSLLQFCPADWDRSDSVDGDDVIAYIVSWDDGDADLNGSGTTDGDDVILFFFYWDQGC
jgi:Tol biopolymer transport system component